MRIWSALEGHLVVVLVDTGSTHNFISSRVAQHVNLHKNSYGKLEVMVVSGEKLSSPKKMLTSSTSAAKGTLHCRFF